ncbi:hypothetical protein CTEN210_18496 [Chaetoceros tenuissimus]|uniref:RING-type domain-containing protein n=1 Tax=Chaetoceros tenuissimus TaxID=426638 RepID=A0AAD3DFE7_9STRA|nr:hypothetical protein CTEN210_18496 [Chaetoceros tenuissimus]
MNQNENQVRPLRRSTRRLRAITPIESSENTTKEGLASILDKEFYQDLECAICLDVLSDPYIIPECCHRFCCDCIHQSIKAGNKECPTCRVHIVSKRNLRRDELFGKMLHRLLKVESEVKVLRLKEKKSTSLPLENDEIDGKEHEHGPNEKEKKKSEPCDKEKKSAKSKKRKGNEDKKHSQTVKKARSNIPFEYRIKELQKFKKTFGHCNVPNRFKDDPSLGHWVTDIRGAYKKIQLGEKPKLNLTHANIEKLEEMGFEWTRQFPKQSLKTNIAKLKKFKQKHGHCNVTQQNKDDPSLGRWVANMRRVYKRRLVGKNTRIILPQSMITQLEDLGFQWEVRNLSFASNITKLQNFKEKYGHCNVPSRYEDDPSLGHWVSDIRYTYKQIQQGNKPKYGLTQARIKQLDEIGFQWKIRSHSSFDTNIAKLRQFKEKYGHCNVPRKYTDDLPLGNWVDGIRYAAKQIQLGKKPRHCLTQADIKMLNKMGFQWQLKKLSKA